MTKVSRPPPGASEADAETSEALDPEDRSRLILRAIRDYAICLLSPEGVIETWNPGAARLTGYASEEIVGEKLTAFYPPGDLSRDKSEEALQQAAAAGTYQDEGWRVRKDGTHFWASGVISAIFGPSKQLSGFVYVIRDLTERKQAEERLRQSEERFRLLVSSVNDYAIFMISPEGLVQTWNLGARRLKGYEAEEIIGQSFTRFYPPEAIAAGLPMRLLQLARDQGRVQDAGWRVRKDGTRFWCEVVLTAVRDETGRLRGFAKVTRDLSARKQAEEVLRQSEQRFRLLVDSVRDYSIFMLDPEGRVTTWNAGAERIKGYSRDEILGKHFSLFYPPEDRWRTVREIEVARQTGRFEEEGWRIRKDGTRFWANVVLTAIHDERGEVFGFAKVTRDLTDRKQAEEERLRLAHAQEAVRLRDEFLSIASHELKTPLQSLKLQLELFARAMRNLEPAALTAVTPKLDVMRRQVERLASLSNSLLDLSAIRAGQHPIELRTVDLAASVQPALESMAIELQLARCELKVEFESGVRVELDPSRFEQVVVNLLSNAAKYGAGRPVEVSVRATTDGAGQVTVTDHGIGISREDSARIFRKFERAVSPDNYGGLGLGLYIAQQLTEAMGGSLSVSSELGQGASFALMFPRVAEAGGPAVG